MSISALLATRSELIQNNGYRTMTVIRRKKKKKKIRGRFKELLDGLYYIRYAYNDATTTEIVQS